MSTTNAAATNTPKPPALSEQQRARAAALDAARVVLAARGPFSSEAVDAMDLVNVASWILDGCDPWTTPDALTADDPAPAGTTLTVPDSPKMLRETLCVAATAVNEHCATADRRDTHIGRLNRLIAECDRHRPLGPDGKHGNRHTATCGCEHVQERPRPHGVLRDLEGR